MERFSGRFRTGDTGGTGGAGGAGGVSVVGDREGGRAAVPTCLWGLDGSGLGLVLSAGLFPRDL